MISSASRWNMSWPTQTSWPCCACRVFRCAAADRDERWPLIIAGGPCVCNAEPMADFIRHYACWARANRCCKISAQRLNRAKSRAWNKERAAAGIWRRSPAVYVPSFYDVTYKEDGRIEAVTPNRPGIPRPGGDSQGHRQGYGQFQPPPEQLRCAAWSARCRTAPVIEVLRGCVRGCRFCQAGFSSTGPSASAMP